MFDVVVDIGLGMTQSCHVAAKIQRKTNMQKNKKSMVTRQSAFKLLKTQTLVPDDHAFGLVGCCLAAQTNLLFRVDCFNGANICARTTVCANVRVNYIDISFADSIYRALINATSACGAIFINYVSHCVKIFVTKLIEFCANI